MSTPTLVDSLEQECSQLLRVQPQKPGPVPVRGIGPGPETFEVVWQVILLAMVSFSTAIQCAAIQALIRRWFENDKEVKRLSLADLGELKPLVATALEELRGEVKLTKELFETVVAIVHKKLRQRGWPDAEAAETGREIARAVESKLQPSD